MPTWQLSASALSTLSFLACLARIFLGGLFQFIPEGSLLEQRLDVAELGRDAALRELEDDLLGPVDEVRNLPSDSSGIALLADVASIGVVNPSFHDVANHAAQRVAERLGVSPLLIGLVLVGFGTSMPELVTSAQAALRNAGESRA